jgi:hypothetical protein
VTWAKLDDRANEHRKQLAAGAEACWLWACGLMYANRQPARDGFIPDQALPMLYPFKRVAPLAKKLVEVGLWKKVPGGYLIHEFEHWNQTKDQADARREAAKLRMRRVRSKGANTDANGSANVRGEHPGEHDDPFVRSSGSDSDSPTDSDSSTPKPPPKLSELQTRAQDWIRLHEHSSTGKQEASTRYGNPASWAEAEPIWAAVFDVFGVEDRPRVASDERTLAVVRRWADGYSTEDLTAAIRGSKLADYIAERRDFQTVATILKDGSRVDKFRALAAPASAPRATQEADDVLDEEARRAVAYDRRQVAELRSAGRAADADRFEREAARKHGAAWTAPTEAA